MRAKFFILLLFTVIGCVNNGESNREYANLSKVITPNPNLKGVRLTQIDTISIDGYSTSLSGRWIVLQNKLAFLDADLIPIQVYLPDGSLDKKIFSKGRGPKELLRPAFTFIELPNGNYFYNSKDQDMILFNNEFDTLSKCNFVICSVYKVLKVVGKDELWKADPENMAIYEMLYTKSVYFAGKIISPVTTEHFEYNGFSKNTRAKEFYRDSYTMSIISLEQKIDIEKLFGHYPPIYRESIIPNFSYNHLASSEDYLYVGYEADPNIYLYDKELKLCGYIGEPVEGIATNFPETTTLDEAESKENEHKDLCGYYSNVNYINGYLFREYVKPNSVNGLQIYKDGNLIFEEDFTNEFNMIGYIEPYYYAHVETDLEQELLKILKFKLE